MNDVLFTIVQFSLYGNVTAQPPAPDLRLTDWQAIPDGFGGINIICRWERLN